MSEYGLNCIVCDDIMRNVHEDIDNQPNGGTIFTSRGNYGSTVWDPVMGDMFLMVNICDTCLKEKAEYVFMGQDYKPVRSPGVGRRRGSVIGLMQVERELVIFNPETKYQDEDDIYTVEDLKDFDYLTSLRNRYDRPLVVWPQGIAFARSIVEHDIEEEEAQWQAREQRGQERSLSE